MPKNQGVCAHALGKTCRACVCEVRHHPTGPPEIGHALSFTTIDAFAIATVLHCWAYRLLRFMRVPLPWCCIAGRCILTLSHYAPGLSVDTIVVQGTSSSGMRVALHARLHLIVTSISSDRRPQRRRVTSKPATLQRIWHKQLPGTKPPGPEQQHTKASQV